MSDMVIGIVIDIILAAIIIISIVRGKNAGFSKTVVSFFAVAIAIFASSFISKTATPIVYENYVGPKIETTINETVMPGYSSYVPNKEEVHERLSEAEEKFPEFILKAVGYTQNKDAIIDSFYENITGSQAQQAIEDYIKPPVIKLIGIIILAVSFLLVLLIVLLIASKLELVNKIPVLGKFNQALGAVLGAVKGLVIALCLCLILSLCISDGTDLLGFITKQGVNSSLIFKTVDNYVFSLILK